MNTMHDTSWCLHIQDSLDLQKQFAESCGGTLDSVSATCRHCLGIILKHRGQKVPVRTIIRYLFIPAYVSPFFILPGLGLPSCLLLRGKNDRVRIYMLCMHSAVLTFRCSD